MNQNTLTVSYWGLYTLHVFKSCKVFILSHIYILPAYHAMTTPFSFYRGHIFSYQFIRTIHLPIFLHDDVIKWKHFPRYLPFVRGIHRSPVNSPHKGQWRGALIFPLIFVGINGWINNREACDLRRYCARYEFNVMQRCIISTGEIIWFYRCQWSHTKWFV